MKNGKNTRAMEINIAANKIITVKQRFDSLFENREILSCFEQTCDPEELDQTCSLSVY